MNRLVSAVAVIGLAVGISLTGVGAAEAGPKAEVGPWEPTGPNPDDSVRGCGTTLTIHDVRNEVETRTITFRDGTQREEYRGRDVTRVSDPRGRRVVLDNSGPYSITTYPDGSVFQDVDSPGLVYYFTAEERRAFRAAGLPAVMYLEKGDLQLSIDADGDEQVLRKPRRVQDVCDLLR